jgi:hypothetical protein
MDEASVEEAIKNRLVVDEKLLKKLAKAVTTTTLVTQPDDVSNLSKSNSPTSSRESLLPPSSDSPLEVKATLCSELKEQSLRLAHQASMAQDDVRFYQQGTIAIQAENSQFAASIEEIRIAISNEQAHLHHHQFLDSLCRQVVGMPGKASLLEELEVHRDEVGKLGEAVNEEEIRLNDLRQKLDKFIQSFEEEE